MVPLGTVGLCACKLLDKYYLGACHCTMASKKLDYQSKQEKAKERKSSLEIVIYKTKKTHNPFFVHISIIFAFKFYNLLFPISIKWFVHTTLQIKYNSLCNLVILFKHYMV